MKNVSNLPQASVYVGTYKKYNNGSLFGQWLTLSDYPDKESFYQACMQLHSDEQDPELMFQDYEYIPESLINEGWISEHVFSLIEIISGMDGNTADAFGIWCSNGHKNFSKADPDDLLETFQDEYIGMYDSEEDFARELMEQRDDLNDFARQYFDYEAYTRDLFCSDYWSDEGHVFYSR